MHPAVWDQALPWQHDISLQEPKTPAAQAEPQPASPTGSHLPPVRRWHLRHFRSPLPTIAGLLRRRPRMSATLTWVSLAVVPLTLTTLPAIAFQSASAPARPAPAMSASTDVQPSDQLAEALPNPVALPSSLASSAVAVPVVPAPSAASTTSTNPAGAPPNRLATAPPQPAPLPAPPPLPPPPPPTTITIKGTVTCLSGKPVEGVWVVGVQGGSGWAPWISSAAQPYFASFHKTISNGAWEVHVGCGGSPANWQVANYSDPVTSAENTFTCQDVPGHPRYGQCWT